MRPPAAAYELRLRRKCSSRGALLKQLEEREQKRIGAKRPCIGLRKVLGPVKKPSVSWSVPFLGSFGRASIIYGSGRNWEDKIQVRLSWIDLIDRKSELACIEIASFPSEWRSDSDWGHFSPRSPRVVALLFDYAELRLGPSSSLRRESRYQHYIHPSIQNVRHKIFSVHIGSEKQKRMDSLVFTVT